MTPQPHDWRETPYGFICMDCTRTILTVDAMPLQPPCPIPYDRNWAEPVEAV